MKIPSHVLCVVVAWTCGFVLGAGRRDRTPPPPPTPDTVAVASPAGASPAVQVRLRVVYARPVDSRERVPAPTPSAWMVRVGDRVYFGTPEAPE